MSSTSITASGNANHLTPQKRSGCSTGVEFTAAVMRKAHEIYRTKIAEEIAARTRCGLSTAYLWKAEERAMDIEDFLALLQGDEAIGFLEVFWKFVPEVARERWIKQEILNRRLNALEHKAKRGRSEIEQLRFELNKR